jgi:hypothetical protein
VFIIIKKMLFLLFLIRIISVSSVLTTVEICQHQQALVFHTFSNDECELDPELSRRGETPVPACGNENIKICTNQGSLIGEEFRCFCQFNGFCYFGWSEIYKTCSPSAIESVDLWLKMSLFDDLDTDEEFDPFDFFFVHFNVWVRGWNGTIEILRDREPETIQEFPDAYDVIIPDEAEWPMHIGITVEHTSPPSENCSTVRLKVYMNGTEVIDTEFEGFSYYDGEYIRFADALPTYEGQPERLFSYGAWECLLNQTQFQYLHSRGPDRSADTMIVCCDEMEQDEDSLVTTLPPPGVEEEEEKRGSWFYIFLGVAIPTGIGWLVVFIVFGVIAYRAWGVKN